MPRKMRKKIEYAPRQKIEYLLSYGARRKLLIQEQVAQLHRTFVDRIESDEMTVEAAQLEEKKTILS